MSDGGITYTPPDSAAVAALQTAVTTLQADVTALQAEIAALPDNVTAVKTGTYNASFGDCIRIDSSGAVVTVNLPAGSLSDKGKSILVMSFFADNPNGVNTIPHGTDTVVGINAAGVPGFITPEYSAMLIFDGVSNWGIQFLGVF